MLKKLTFLLIVFQTIGAKSQIDIEKLINDYPLRNIGPAAMSGRITAIAVPNNSANLKNENIIYAGSASGGVWKSENAGYSWNPIFDEMDVQSIGAIAIDPTDANVVYIGTGEGNPRNSHNSGKGIYKSIDGGKTWKCIGLESTKTIHRILIDPLNSNTIYVASLGSIWGPTSHRGVYKSIDGGQTWKQILFANTTTGCGELVMDPNHPGKLFAAMYDFQRKPFSYRSGGEGSGLYLTYDGGQTWQLLQSKNGLPKGNLGRIGLCVARSNSNRVYALIESSKTAMYRSDDGGINWYKTTDHPNIGNRPFYYSEIYCDPVNENLVYSIWSQVSKSDNGGKNWEILADWGHIHPDHHAFFIHPDNPNYIINGNDGGLNISYDKGKSWRFAQNIPVGQFYHVNVDNSIPYNVYGGLQDNGSWVGPGFVFSHGGILNHHWKELLYGDGFDVAPIENNNMEGYAMYQGGNLYHYNLKSQITTFIKPQVLGNINLRYNWNAALSLLPNHPDKIYYGSQFLHFSENKGKSWTVISPDLTTNDTSKLHQAKSGGLTIDATGAENYCTIISIAPSPLDPLNYIVVGTDDGNVQLTQNHGKEWKNCTASITGLPKNSWITQIHIDTINRKNIIYVVANNYRQNDWNPYLFKSTDDGKTWQNIIGTTNQIVKGHCLSVFVDPKNHNLVFLGTDQGLWISINGGKEWKKWKKFPSCPVQDIKFQENENDIVIATFGRGIWVIDDISALRNSLIFQNQSEVKILSASHGYLANYSQPNGARFEADVKWSAPNKNTNVVLNIWAKFTKKDSGLQKETIVCKVFNSENKPMQSFKFTLDSTGFHKVSWTMTEEGVFFPSYQTPGKDELKPSGRLTKPGNYKFVLYHKNKPLDSCKATINFPITLGTFNEAAFQYQTVLLNKFYPIVTTAQKIFERLKDMEKFISKIESFTNSSDSFSSKFQKFKKPLLDSISKYKDYYMLPEGTNYYEESTPRLMDLLGNTNQLIISGIDFNENSKEYLNIENAIVNCEFGVKSIENKLNKFNEVNWKPFLEFVKKYQSEFIHD